MMRRANKVAQLFPKHLFWDVDYSKLNPLRDSDIIIPRALFASTPESFAEDITKLESLYSPTQIVDELKRTKERISNQVCLLVSKRYHLPPFSRFHK